MQDFSQGGGGVSTMWNQNLIAGYTDREDLEAFSLSKTGGEQGGGGGRPGTRLPSQTHPTEAPPPPKKKQLNLSTPLVDMTRLHVYMPYFQKVSIEFLPCQHCGPLRSVPFP